MSKLTEIVRDNVDDLLRFDDELRVSFDELRAYARSQSSEHIADLGNQLRLEIESCELTMESCPEDSMMWRGAHRMRLMKLAKYGLLFLIDQDKTAPADMRPTSIQLPSGNVLTADSSEEDFMGFAHDSPSFLSSNERDSPVSSQSKGCLSMLICSFSIFVLLIISSSGCW